MGDAEGNRGREFSNRTRDAAPLNEEPPSPSSVRRSLGKSGSNCPLAPVAKEKGWKESPTRFENLARFPPVVAHRELFDTQFIFYAPHATTHGFTSRWTQGALEPPIH